MKRTIIERSLPKSGTVRFAFPTTAMAVIDARELMRTVPEGPRRDALMHAAMVANCLVDENGRQIYSGYSDLLENLCSDKYAEIANDYEIVYSEQRPPSGEQEKNSESAPISSSPTTSV